ncbi:hypothetical protein [Burkholderia gladioli]|uniref:hypothetical protein n=1 Tax=Burkholderia gladioli TaxID=28095 RepID=UPI000B026EF4|nr:hypothetical protein [Burkholderia gladioli]MDA0573092.1 hypothetical protein [Burkholderia gladioli]MDA0600539.1 hypothetical protein [Burkholderia gladioli]
MTIDLAGGPFRFSCRLTNPECHSNNPPSPIRLLRDTDYKQHDFKIIMKIFFGILGAAILLLSFPARPWAATTYICGYDISKNSAFEISDVVISIDKKDSVAIACNPGAMNYRETFHLVEDTSTDIVFSSQHSSSAIDKEATSVFGLDLRTGRLYHCLNRFRMPGNPIWVATCIKADNRQTI